MPNLENKSSPSDEELKKFWEWCGWKHFKGTYLHYSPEQMQESIVKGIPNVSEAYANFPDLDLNNLFKYAVPKLDGYRAAKVLSDWLNRMQMDYSNAANYLFWAIYSVIE